MLLVILQSTRLRYIFGGIYIHGGFLPGFAFVPSDWVQHLLMAFFAEWTFTRTYTNHILRRKSGMRQRDSWFTSTLQNQELYPTCRNTTFLKRKRTPAFHGSIQQNPITLITNCRTLHITNSDTLTRACVGGFCALVTILESSTCNERIPPH